MRTGGSMTLLFLKYSKPVGFLFLIKFIYFFQKTQTFLINFEIPGTGGYLILIWGVVCGGIP
jgi:hypothetical protein